MTKEAPSQAQRGPLVFTAGLQSLRCLCKNATPPCSKRGIVLKATFWADVLSFVPLFQVGTLDVLVGLSDELAKLDGFVEGYATICLSAGPFSDPM